MIYLLRTIKIQPEKNVEAFDWAAKVAAYINEHFPETEVQVLSNISGNRWQLHWLCRCESLAVFETTSAKWWEDAGFQALMPESGELIVQSSWTDTFYSVHE